VSAQPMALPAETEARPQASIVVCTRNRGENIQSTLRSLLANSDPAFELIVIDQSTDDTTAQAVAAFGGDGRLRYLRSSTQGLSVARNLGLMEAQGELVLMTDDDCEVPADWIAQMVAIFTQHPQVACVFCDVLAGPFDASAGFVPYSIHKRESLVAQIEEYEPGAGIGAGMALRRSAALDIGGFDEQLGAGRELASGEEVDLVLRLLLKGYQIYHTKATSVVHHGFRTYAEGRKLVRGYMYGSSAVYAKLLKCGHWCVLPLYLAVVWMSVFDLALESLRNRKLPPVSGRIAYLVKGFLRGWRMPVNRADALFLPLQTP
jgi:glycosyltransferase involved in cell wall biosynthesis